MIPKVYNYVLLMMLKWSHATDISTSTMLLLLHPGVCDDSTTLASYAELHEVAIVVTRLQARRLWVDKYIAQVDLSTLQRVFAHLNKE